MKFKDVSHRRRRRKRKKKKKRNGNNYEFEKNFLLLPMDDLFHDFPFPIDDLFDECSFLQQQPW